jgi:hypothetical protein
MENSVVIENDVELTKKGTVRKRKPKKKNTYFTEETEEYILQYRAEARQHHRDRIYRDHLHYAFYKLAENIIHSFKFYYIDTNSIEDLKYEVISFLLEKVNLYNQSKGKAYSYFGTIAKRYLISYNQKNYKKLLAKVELTEIHNDNKTIDKLIENNSEVIVDIDVVYMNFLNYLELNVLDLYTNETDIKIATSLLEIFKKIESFENINKKLIFLYVKEMTDESTINITKVLKSMKAIYKRCLDKEYQKIDSSNIYSY